MYEIWWSVEEIENKLNATSLPGNGQSKSGVFFFFKFVNIVPYGMAVGHYVGG